MISFDRLFRSALITPVIRIYRQSGVTLIEVMIALFILVFGALAIANMQVSAMSSAKIASSHFAVSNIADEVVEQLKADYTEAGTGGYNTSFADTSAAATVPAQRAAIINGWKSATAAAMPDGVIQITCITTECTVSLRWRENVTGGVTQQLYNLRTPLQSN